MIDLSTFSVFASVAVVGVVGTGCTTTCTSFETSGETSGATLVLEVSPAYVAWEEYRGPTTQASSEVTTALDSCMSGPCIEASATGGSAVTIEIPTPAGPGVYDVAMLGGVACDRECAPLAGTLVVRAIGLPCGAGACGKLDADLDLTRASTTGPWASGRATLAYSETSLHYACSSVSFGDG